MVRKEINHIYIQYIIILYCKLENVNVVPTAVNEKYDLLEKKSDKENCYNSTINTYEI